MPLVDSHCHLDCLDPASLEGGLAAVLNSARLQDVAWMLCVSIDLERWPAMMDLIRGESSVYASVGVHPNHREGHDPSVDELVTLAQDPQIVAIGETGLDYYRQSGDVEWQQARFRRHIRAARESGKPLIIHCREAREDVLRLLREERADEIGGVMHCFSEDADTALRAVELGFYISFSGIITFRNAAPLRDVALRVPAERLLVETDAPYLAPVPYRGRPNVPAHVRHVAECVAQLRQQSYEELAAQTTANFFRLFSSARAG